MGKVTIEVAVIRLRLNVSQTGTRYQFDIQRLTLFIVQHDRCQSQKALPRRRLLTNESFVQLLVGLAVSCVLFFLALFLPSTSQAVSGSNSLEDTGILQITWLLGNDSHFARIQKPETQILRRAGMFEVEMDEMVREKMVRVQSLDDCEIEVSETTMLTRASAA